MEKITISVERTGEIFSINGCEFKITYPDGTTENIWSPPWHDMEEELEEATALEQAISRWMIQCKARDDTAFAQLEELPF